LQERVARELGFQLVGHRLELHGIPLNRKKD
jgi:Fur family ferric uptake transcriptional regulator